VKGHFAPFGLRKAEPDTHTFDIPANCRINGLSRIPLSATSDDSVTAFRAFFFE